MAQRLTKLKVDEVSVVDKGANNKRFLILKSDNRQDGPPEPGSIRKADQPPLLGRARNALRKVAGTAGRNSGGTDMTPEDVRKAVAEAADEVLEPFEERIAALESLVAKAAVETQTEEAPVEEEAAEALTAEVVAKMLSDALAPIAGRLDVIESATGTRRSGIEEQGPHTVRKSAGSFSWEGSGVLI